MKTEMEKPLEETDENQSAQKVPINAEPPKVIAPDGTAAPIQEPKLQKKKPKPRVTKTGMNIVAVMSGATLILFRELMTVAKVHFSEEVPLEFDGDKLVVKMMNTSRVAMLYYVFPKQVFEEYDVGNRTRFKPIPLPAKITVYAEKLIYMMKDAKKDDQVRFNIEITSGLTKQIREKIVRIPERCPKCYAPTDRNAHKPEVIQKHPRWYKCRCGWKTSKLKQKKMKEKVLAIAPEVGTTNFKVEVRYTDSTENFKLLTIESNDEEVPIPKISFNINFKMVAEKLKKKLERMQEETDHITLSGSHEGLIIKGYSDLMPDFKTSFLRGSDALLDIDEKTREPQTATFSLSYLPNMLPPKKGIADVVALEYSTNMPIRITWQTDVGDAQAVFFLAPRIECD